MTEIRERRGPDSLPSGFGGGWLLLPTAAALAGVWAAAPQAFGEMPERLHGGSHSRWVATPMESGWADGLRHASASMDGMDARDPFGAMALSATWHAWGATSSKVSPRPCVVA